MLFFSFTVMPAFPLGKVEGATALGGRGIPHGQQQVQIVLLAPHQDRTKQGRRRCSHSTDALDNFAPLFRGFSQQDLSRQSFLGHSGYTVELT